jgi:hypothetical protein
MGERIVEIRKEEGEEEEGPFLETTFSWTRICTSKIQ